jgi:multidrug efflux pump subunit AcrA (membrane-fusion protein)
MKRQRIIPILIVAMVVVVAGAAGFYFYTNPTVWRRTLTELELAEPQARGLTASGFIEAEEIDIAPELGGRVADLLVEEGDDVAAGGLLVRIDGTLLEAQIDLARAGVQIAEAQLSQVKAGARPAVIRQGEADLAQAEAACDGAYQAWQDAEAIRDNPQELDAEITRARSEVETAEAELAAAAALKDAAVIAYEQYSDVKDSWEDKKENLREKLKDLPEDMRPSIPNEIPAQLDFHMIPYQHWKAWVGVNTAEAALQGASTALNDLLAMRSNPQDLNAQLDAAQTEYQAARAIVDQAEARLAALRSGATQEEIAAAEAQVDQAQASLDKLLYERNKLLQGPRCSRSATWTR